MASLYPRTTVTITIQELENKGHVINFMIFVLYNN